MKKSIGTSLQVHACHGLTTVLVAANTVTLATPPEKRGVGYFLILAFENVALAGNALSALAIRNGGNTGDLATFTAFTMGPTTADADTALILSLDKYLADGAGSGGSIRFLFTPAAAPTSYVAMIVSVPKNEAPGYYDGNGNTYYLEEA